MEFNIKSGHPEKQRTACVVVGVYEPRRLSDAARQLDEASKGYLSSILRRGDIEGKIGQTLLLHSPNNKLLETTLQEALEQQQPPEEKDKDKEILADRILLVGCGRERELGDVQYRKIITQAIKTLHETGAMETVCYLTELNVRSRDTAWRIRHAIETANVTLYSFDQLKSKKNVTRRPLRRIVFTVASRKELNMAERARLQAEAISSGVKLTRDLANLPANICTPSYLTERAKSLCALHEHMKCQILTPQEMEKAGMNALLAVAQGSEQPPQLIILEYQGSNYKENKKPEGTVALVGKGVTFDSGGISIKPSKDMDEMKYDMAGAASVLGVLSVVAELRLPIDVIGVIPAVENLPSGKAIKPGDIVTTLSGQTVEILNTDAEGRLILCDALTYIEKYNPEIVIDIATLTGACIVALGGQAHGLLSNHNPLTNDLLNAGRWSYDRAWELPLWEEYQELLDSPFADMANISGGKGAGTITAACFLSRFTKKYQWAHLDIAGTAWISGGKEEKSATGRPVPLLSQYLIERCSKEGGVNQTPLIDEGDIDQNQ